jgi:hypothetical protein
MSGDAALLAAEMTPYISAAVGAYGEAVLTSIPDDVPDPMVSLGPRLLLRIFGFRSAGDPLPAPFVNLAADPSNKRALTAVQLMVRVELAAEPVIAAEVRSLLARAPGGEWRWFMRLRR